ncbi:aromatic-ring hydroxylase C-terminal domain-containing protein [Spiractinospora alimapuensis]|uniref:aromatic-ring hydroxylase C-terminal domain-containing protein n=1 Tax=Spiractinospora alimapuensis TaxID=2820884 RepID=UPI001F1A7F2C|nr:hypothetical protein [Spiractinospora alimapuensis]
MNSRIQLGEGAILRYFREHVLLGVIGLSPVQRWATKIASQLGVSYRKGPLGGHRALLSSGRPGVGDRVPDLPCLRPDGTETRLHSELGRHWVLLTPTDLPPTADAARARLGDHVVTLRPQARGLTDHLLVRPDAHLLWRGDADGDGPAGTLDALLRTGRIR